MTYNYSNGELMRSVVVSVILALLMSLAFVSPASADHRARSYCSEDFCAGTKRGDDGARRFWIDSFAFESYTLCVWHVGKAKTCNRFEMEMDSEQNIFHDRIRWLRHYPDQGPGKYKFVYRVYGNRITPILGFHKS